MARLVERRLPFWRELLSRWALCALVLAPLVVYAPRVLFPPGSAGPAGPLGRTAPAAPEPAWIHLVVLTTGDVPAASGARLPALAAWRERSSHARRVVPATGSVAGNAATLWTGRWAAHHGVLSEDRALAADAWTLAEAARRSGAATAAFLEAPFASATRVGGFGILVEEPDIPPDELAEELGEFLAAAAGRRALLWVHRRAAPDRSAAESAAELDAVVARVERLYREAGLWPDTATLLVPLAGAGDAPESGGLAVPAWIAFPASGWGGRRGDALVALLDLTAILRDALRLPPPDPLRRESPLHGRPERTAGVLRGWDADLDALHHDEERALWLRPDGVLEAPQGPATDARELVLWVDGAPLRPQSEGEAAAWLADYLEREREARRNAVPAPAARVPREWRDGAAW